MTFDGLEIERRKKLLLHWLSPNKDPSITFSASIHHGFLLEFFAILKNASKIIGDAILRHWIKLEKMYTMELVNIILQ